MFLELAQETDWNTIRTLSVQIHDLHVSWRPDIFCHSEEPYPKEKFLDDIQNRLVHVARHESSVVGYVVLSIMRKSGPGVVDHTLLRLDSICVDKAHRGKGIGSVMMEGVFALAKAFGCSDVILGVHPENDRAVEFYQKCGFSLRTINMQAKV